MTTKTCSKCKEEKSLDEYSRKGVRKDGTQKYQPYCKPCQNVNTRKYYNSNKEYHKKQVRVRAKRALIDKRKLMVEYFNSHPCADCGNSDIRVLEFDHVSGEKEGNVSELLSSGYRWERVLTEIQKCEVVCANCHRIRTYTRQQTYRTAPT